MLNNYSFTMVAFSVVVLEVGHCCAYLTPFGSSFVNRFNCEVSYPASRNLASARHIRVNDVRRITLLFLHSVRHNM